MIWKLRDDEAGCARAGSDAPRREMAFRRPVLFFNRGIGGAPFRAALNFYVPLAFPDERLGEHREPAGP